MHSKNQAKKLTDRLTVLTKNVTLQVRSKTHSNKPNKQNKWTSTKPEFWNKFNSQLQYSYCICLQVSLTNSISMMKSCKSKIEKNKRKTYFVLLELYSYTALTNPETNSCMQSNKTYSEHMP